MDSKRTLSIYSLFLCGILFFVIQIASSGWAVDEVVEDTATPTPTITPIPSMPATTPTPNQNDSSLTVVELDGPDLSANHLAASPPAGFISPKLSFGSIPESVGSDGKGLRVDLSPGQGTLIICLDPIKVNGLARISGTFRSDSQSLTIAVIGLNNPIDGQIGYTNITGPEIVINQYRTMDLVYSPPSGTLNLAFQVVNMPFSALSGTVYIDNLKVEMLEPQVGKPVTLAVPGDFESNLKDLKINYNNVDGDVIPFFESITDVALKLTIQPENLAANFGTFATGLGNDFPFSLLGEISVQRDSEPDGGMTGFVMTNGNQSIAVFRNTDEIPSSSTGIYEKVIIGGDFTTNNPEIPINVVVQNGGPGVSATIIADDLNLRKYASFDPIPPTPTPVQIDLDSFEMILIPSGTFLMGSPDIEKDHQTEEGPQHQVTINKPFYMGKYEVTQAQWKAVMGDNPSNFKGDNLPVEQVSWDDVQLFLSKMNQLGDGSFRLPTEAEWEYACRAGTTTRFYWGDGDDQYYGHIGNYAWYPDNSSSKTHEVGTKIPNSWGLYDMKGNVREWCQDWYGAYSADNQNDPTGPASGTKRVARGGSINDEIKTFRSAYRGNCLPSNHYYYLGFRLVRSYQ